jgi:hypothetical protein
VLKSTNWSASHAVFWMVVLLSHFSCDSSLYAVFLMSVHAHEALLTSRPRVSVMFTAVPHQHNAYDGTRHVVITWNSST